MLDGAANIEVVPFTPDRERPITTEEFDEEDVVIAGGRRVCCQILKKRAISLITMVWNAMSWARGFIGPLQAHWSGRSG